MRAQFEAVRAELFAGKRSLADANAAHLQEAARLSRELKVPKEGGGGREIEEERYRWGRGDLHTAVVD